MRTMTKEEAVAAGMTASQVRTVARSLQRIGTKGYLHHGTYITCLTHPAECRRNAWSLFKVAKEIEKAS